MLLQLDDNYRIINTDGRNFSLERLEDVEIRKTKEIKKEYKLKGHFGRLEHALSKYIKDDLVSDKDKTTVQELIEHMKQMDKKIVEIAKEQNIDWDYSKKAAKDE